MLRFAWIRLKKRRTSEYRIVNIESWKNFKIGFAEGRGKLFLMAYYFFCNLLSIEFPQFWFSNNYHWLCDLLKLTDKFVVVFK